MKVDWNRFDYKNKKSTAPGHENAVWIREDFYEDGVSLGYFDGYTFRTVWGSDDCHVSHWADIAYPDDPGPGPDDDDD